MVFNFGGSSIYSQIIYMQKIIVTGASKGIGYATSLSLAEKGNTVFAVARSEELLQQLVDESGGRRIIPITTDISTETGRALLLNAVHGVNGIDGLINNAALLINKPFVDLTLDEWKQQFETNFFSIVCLIKSLLPSFNREAHIVNIGSMAGFQGAQKYAQLSAYGAGKAALANLTEYLAIELFENEIRVNCLALGAVSTDMLNAAFPNYKSEISAEMMGNFIATFTTKNGKLFNGKVIPVAVNNPN